MLRTKLFILLYLVYMANAQYIRTPPRQSQKPLPIRSPSYSNVVEMKAAPTVLPKPSGTISEPYIIEQDESTIKEDESEDTNYHNIASITKRIANSQKKFQPERPFFRPNSPIPPSQAVSNFTPVIPPSEKYVLEPTFPKPGSGLGQKPESEFESIVTEFVTSEEKRDMPIFRPRSSEPEPQSELHTETELELKSESELDLEPEPEQDFELESEFEIEPKPETEFTQSLVAEPVTPEEKPAIPIFRPRSQQPEPETEIEPVPEPEIKPKPESQSKPDSEQELEYETELESELGQESESGPDPESEYKPKADTETTPSLVAEPATPEEKPTIPIFLPRSQQPETETETELVPEPEMEPKPESKSETGSESQPEPDSKQESKYDPELKSELEQESESGPEPEYESKPDTELTPSLVAEPVIPEDTPATLIFQSRSQQPELELETDPEAIPDLALVSEQEPEIESEPIQEFKIESEPELESEPESELKPKTNPSPSLVAELITPEEKPAIPIFRPRSLQPEPEIETEAETELEIKPKQESESENGSATQTEPDYEQEPELDSEQDTELDSEQESELDSEQETELESEHVQESELGFELEQESEPKPDTQHIPSLVVKPVTPEEKPVTPIFEPRSQQPESEPKIGSETVTELELILEEEPKTELESQPEPEIQLVTEFEPKPELEHNTPQSTPLLVTKRVTPEKKQKIPRFRPRLQPPEPEAKTKPDLEAKSETDIPSTSTSSLCKVKNAYYANPQACDTYIECQNYIAKNRVCPDGLLFDTKAVWPRYPCVYPSEVECGNKTTTHVSKPTSKCPRRFGTFATNSGDCGKYIVCDDGRPSLMNCPTGLAFNPKIGGCDWPDNVPNCNPKVFKNFICPVPSTGSRNKLSTDIHNYRYKQSCKEYIACVKGEPRLLRCDSGLSFDENTGRCIDSDKVLDCKIVTDIVDTKLYIKRV